MSYTKLEFYNALNSIEIGPSNSVFIATQLSKVGPLKEGENKTEKLKILHEAFKDRVGSNGTITVPTWNYDTINKIFIYDHEKNPSKAGIFTEYVRKLPGTVRSLHPFESYASIGQNARYICEDVSRHDFGPNTVLDRLLKLDTVALNIGIHPSQALSLIHHAEFVVGVPYRYHKEFLFTVKAYGREYKDYFYTLSRFISSEINQDNKKKLFKVFNKMGYKIGEVKLGIGNIYFYRMREMYAALLELLKDDIYGLLEIPPKTRIYSTTI